MNSTELYIAAGKAIAEWQANHNCSCGLSIRDGKVICSRAGPGNKHEAGVIYVSCWHQIHGFGSTEWTTIGNALFNQYTKELTRQTHQKH